MPLITRVEGAKGGLSNQHGALHLALFPLLHDQFEVLAEVCLEFEIIKSENYPDQTRYICTISSSQLKYLYNF